MDCNWEEALEAKEIAEKKFDAKDIWGAKKFAMKAHNLSPSLEGISQMIATLDVHLAAERKINGESDWYAILSVDASTDEESLKKHYRKLALQLHPDKNKSVGAEGAFKLISEAWSVLSDKDRKMAYDQSRNGNCFQNKAPQPFEDASANGFYSFSNTTTSKKRARKRGNGSCPSVLPQSHTINLSTFWTSCKWCRMQYEYLRIYLNHNLLCPNCHQAFVAIEIGVPANAANSSIAWSGKQHQYNSNHNYPHKNGYSSCFSTSTFTGTAPMEFQSGGSFDSCNHQNFKWKSFTGSSGTTGKRDSTFQAENLLRKKFEKMRRKQEKVQTAAKKEELFFTDNYVSHSANAASGNYSSGQTVIGYDQDRPISKVGRPPKRRSSDYPSINHEIEAENRSTCPRESLDPDVERGNGAFPDNSRNRVTSRQKSFTSEFSQINIQQILINKIKATLSKKLEEWSLAQEMQLGEKYKIKQKSGQDAVAMDEGTGKKTCLDDSGLEKKVLTPVSIDVPDPDFYDFDNDRQERTFACDQVWATYDSEDSMPRLYAMVQKVISHQPFQVCISFLSSNSNSELGSINWVASGFAKTCGDFRVSRYQVSDTVNIFSHKVQWEKGPRGVIRIFPKKGDTWALYRNWSPDWNELTPDTVIYKYEIVEALGDYTDEHGVSVIPLVKVAGFKSVFHRHTDAAEVKRILRVEMFRFSHQVPSYELTGEEADNALKGCLELDPAATPLELLQVITEAKEDVEMRNK